MIMESKVVSENATENIRLFEAKLDALNTGVNVEVEQT